MAETEKPILGDKDLFPSNELLCSVFGDKMVLWLKLISYVKDNYKDVTGEWRYYNDGKQWLFKMQQKKKTIFWASVLKNTFRITFYFGNKSEPVIEGSTLPQKIKDGFRDARRFGTLRPITTIVNENQDFDNILKLIDVKVKIK
jgi:Protein of unknown function (DUF3788)